MTKTSSEKAATVGAKPKREKKQSAVQSKKLSNPVSTGGAGVAYEARVQAVYLLAMFGGLPVAIYPEAKVTCLQFQARIHDYRTDDLVCTVQDEVGGLHKVLIQVKRAAKSSEKNQAFEEAITAAWFDYQNTELFTHNVDRLVVVYDGLGQSDLQGATAIANYARTSISGVEFLKKSTAANFSSGTNRNAYKAILAVITNVLQGPVFLDDFHRFVRHLWFVSHELSSDNTQDFTQQLSLIKLLLGDELVFNPLGVWSQLVSACQKLNVVAGSVSFANLDEQLSSRIAARFRAHRQGAAATLTLSGLSPEVIQAAGRTTNVTSMGDTGGTFPVLSGAVTVSSTAPPSDVLSSARPGSANIVISAQLDAISSKLKRFHYRDAREDLRAIGKDHGLFDEHQKARWYQQRGICTWHLGEDLDAAADFIRAADLSSDDDKMVAARIRGLMLLKRTDEAVTASEAALGRFPESLHVWLASANAKMVTGEHIELHDVPVDMRNEADVLQTLAWSKHFRGLDRDAVSLVLRAIQVESAGFFTRHAALAIVIQAVMKGGILCFYGLLPEDLKTALEHVTEAFKPRIERLWDAQASETVASAATHLGCAYLLLNNPGEALKIVQEADAYGVDSPGLLRVELDALDKLGKSEELLKFGNANVRKLNGEGLVRLAQEAGNLADLALVDLCVDAGANLTPSDPWVSDVLRAIRWTSYLRSYRKVEIIDEIRNAGLEKSKNLHLVVAGARILWRTDEKDAADRLIVCAKAIQNEVGLQEGELILAELYFDLKRFADAIPHYVNFLPKGQHSELHNRLFCCYLKVGSTRKAKQLLESFPKEWIDDDDSRSLAIELGQLASDWRMLTSLADTQFKKESNHISSWLFKFMVDVRRKSVSDLQAFLATAPMDLSGSIHQVSQLAGLELRYGLETNGMRRMYQMRRRNLENVESASALVLTIVGVSARLPNMEQNLDIVSPGTSLTLQDDKGNLHTLTIDPAELPLLPESGEFKPATSDEAARFIGAKVGTQVEVGGPYGQTRIFMVTAISSAYRRLHDCAHHALTTSITPASNLMSMSVPTGPDGKADFSEMLGQLQRSSAHGKAAMHQYETHPISLGFLGKLLGKNPIELVQVWPSNGPALASCEGTLPERMAAVGLLEDFARTFVIDGATLAEFVFLECTAALAIFPTLYISEIGRDTIYGMLEAAKHNRSVGHAFEEDGKLGFIEHTDATHKREVARLEAVITALEKFCVVQPAYGPENPPELLLELKELTSEDEYATLMLASEKEAVLVSLDGHLRGWAAAVNIQGVWPQVVLMQAERTGVLSKDQYALSAARLFMAQRAFTALNSYDLLILCMQGDTWLQFGFSKYLRHLAHPNTEFETALNVALAFIQELSAQLLTFGVVAEFVRHLVHGLLRHPECPDTMMSIMDNFLERLIKPARTYADFYPPAADTRQRQYEAQLGFLKEAAREGEAWSHEPWRERDVQVRVMHGGRSPMFVNLQLKK